MGLVLVGEHEVNRTLRASSAPKAALAAVETLLAGVLGTLLAAEEWRTVAVQTGGVPGRDGLGFGFNASLPRPYANGAHRSPKSD